MSILTPTAQERRKGRFYAFDERSDTDDRQLERFQGGKPRYRGIERRGVDLAGALKEASDQYGVRITPVRARKWIAMGALPGHLGMVGASERGGVKGCYPDDFALCVAVADTLQRCGVSLAKIAAMRVAAEQQYTPPTIEAAFWLAAKQVVVWRRQFAGTNVKPA